MTDNRDENQQISTVNTTQHNISQFNSRKTETYSLERKPSDIKTSSTLGRACEFKLREFQIIQKIGEGTYGKVLKVRHKSRFDVYVMKQIAINSSDPCDLNYKLNECHVQSKLRHPYIIRYRDYFVDESLLCILFEFCDKGDLETYLNNNKRFGSLLSEQRIKKFILEILLALDYLHSQGIVHRDVKPSNIYLKGKDYIIQVGDFGCAAQRESKQIKIVEDVGTLLFQAPEMLQGMEYDS